MTRKEQIKILNNKIKTNNAQYNIDRLNAEISAFSEGTLDKYEFLTCKDLKYKPNALDKAKFEFSALGKAFNQDLDKTVQGYQEEGVIKLLKDIRDGLAGGINNRSNRNNGRNSGRNGGDNVDDDEVDDGDDRNNIDNRNNGRNNGDNADDDGDDGDEDGDDRNSIDNRDNSDDDSNNIDNRNNVRTNRDNVDDDVDDDGDDGRDYENRIDNSDENSIDNSDKNDREYRNGDENDRDDRNDEENDRDEIYKIFNKMNDNLEKISNKHDDEDNILKIFKNLEDNKKFLEKFDIDNRDNDVDHVDYNKIYDILNKFKDGMENNVIYRKKLQVKKMICVLE